MIKKTGIVNKQFRHRLGKRADGKKFPNRLAQYLYEYRMEKKLSQEQLAEDVFLISTAAYQKIESGRRKTTDYLLGSISRNLNLTVGELSEMESQPPAAH